MQAVPDGDGSLEPATASGSWARTKRLARRSGLFIRKVGVRFGWPLLVILVGAVMRWGPSLGPASMQSHRMGGALLIAGVLGCVALGFSVVTLRVATVIAVFAVLFALSDVGESVRDRVESREYTALRSSVAVELNVTAAGNITRKEVEARLASAEDTLGIAHAEVWTATRGLWKLARDDFHEGVALLDGARVSEHCAGLAVDIARLEVEVVKLDQELVEAEAALSLELGAQAVAPDAVDVAGDTSTGSARGVETASAEELSAGQDSAGQPQASAQCLTHAVHNPVQSALHPHRDLRPSDGGSGGGSTATSAEDLTGRDAVGQGEEGEAAERDPQSADQEAANAPVALVVRREVDEATDTATVVDGIRSRIRWSFDQILRTAQNAEELAQARERAEWTRQRASEAREAAALARSEAHRAEGMRAGGAMSPEDARERADRAAAQADRAEAQAQRARQRLLDAEEAAKAASPALSTRSDSDNGDPNGGKVAGTATNTAASAATNTGTNTADPRSGSGDEAAVVGAQPGEANYLNALPAYPGARAGCVEPGDAEIDSFGFAAMRERADECVVGCVVAVDPALAPETPQGECLPRMAKRIVLLAHQSQLERFTQQGVATDQQSDLLKRLDEVEAQLAALDEPVPVHHLIRDGSDEIFGSAVAAVIDPDTAARIGPWAWVIVAVILILAYRMLEILNDGREPGPVAVQGFGNSIGGSEDPAGSPKSLDAQATELVRTYLGLAQLQEPSPVPGGNAVRGITDYTDSKGSEYAIVSILLRLFQGTAFPKRGVEIEVQGSELEPKPGNPKAGYRVVVSAKEARTSRLLFVQPYESESLETAAMQASHSAAERLLNRGWTTPDWLRWNSRDGSGLLAYQKVAIADADPSQRLPSDKRKRYLEAAVASSPDTGAAQVMLANELSMHRELSRSAFYLLLTRGRHPHFLTGRYRLGTTLSSITADMDRCWYGTRFDRGTEHLICEAILASTPFSGDREGYVLSMVNKREAAWRAARANGLYETNQLDVIDALINLHRTDPSWRRKFCELCGPLDLTELRERVLVHQGRCREWNSLVASLRAAGVAPGESGLMGWGLDPELTNEVRRVLLVAAIIEFGEVERYSGLGHALAHMTLQKERSYWLRILRSPALRSSIRAGARSARILAERRWLAIKYFDALTASNTDPIEIGSIGIERAQRVNPKKVNTVKRLARSANAAQGPGEFLSLMKALDHENLRAVEVAPDDAIPRYNRACYLVEVEVFHQRNSLVATETDMVGSANSWRALSAVHPDPEALRDAAEDLRRARLSRGGQNLSLEWMEADVDLAPLMASEAWKNARDYIRKIDSSLANLGSGPG